jgi:hypothetical protein
MKNLFLVLLALFVVNITVAQENKTQSSENEYKTIFSKPNTSIKVSGFGAVNFDFGYTDNNLRVLPGLDLAALFNRSFFVGLYGRLMGNAPTYNYTFFSKHLNKDISVSHNTIFGHGGLLVGGIFFANKPIHFGISGRFGVGGVALHDSYNRYNYDNSYQEFYDYPYSDPVFVFSPQADIEMNITNWFKFRVSAGYQYVSSSSVNYITYESGKYIEKELFNTSTYSTPTVTLGLVFGWFK